MSLSQVFMFYFKLLCCVFFILLTLFAAEEHIHTLTHTHRYIHIYCMYICLHKFVYVYMCVWVATQQIWKHMGSMLLIQFKTFCSLNSYSITSLFTKNESLKCNYTQSELLQTVFRWGLIKHRRLTLHFISTFDNTVTARTKLHVQYVASMQSWCLVVYSEH